MAKFDHNVAVIGAGSAGLVSSYICSAVKAKVVLIEKNKMGGDCLNTGCVPSKALIRSAKILSYIQNHKRYGIHTANAEFEFSEIMDRVHSVISKVEPHDSVERYTKLGVDCIKGSAKIISPHEVEVNGKILTAKNIIIATGARPTIPNIKGLDKINFLTTDTVWNLRELPKRLIIAGGGPIGCELTQCFARLGSKVTQIQTRPKIMIREDDEVGELISKKFQEEGVDVRVNAKSKEVVIENGEKFLVVEENGREDRIPFDEILLAVGRTANAKGFGLEELGIELSSRGTIAVDDYLRTTKYSNIYACGDVAGPYQFTHTAAHQAWYCAVNALFSPLKKFKVDYSVIPWSTFTDPEVARVGLSENEAIQQGIDFESSVYPIDDLDRAIADSEDHGWIKVLTPPGKDKVLGVTIVADHAGDLIAEYVLAMKNNIGLNSILSTIHIYPTMAEANKFVAGVWKKAHAPQTILNWLERFHRWRRG